MSNSSLHGLEALVIKTGVAIGGLTDPQRQAALCLAALALPAGSVLSEAQVNLALKAFLGAAGQFLDTDHVELRRWLVDTGWWRRDGFGRAYERTAVAALSAEQQALHAAVNALDGQAWAAARRAQAQALRDARRQAWQAQQASPGCAP